MNNETMTRVGKIFEAEMLDALTEKPSSLQMENTYIPELPNGSGSRNLQKRS